MATSPPLQRTRTIVRGNGPPGLVVGQCVYLSGPPSGGLWTFALADAYTNTAHLGVGFVVQTLPSNQYQVQTYGVLDTFSGLTPGLMCFLGASGAITQTAPTATAVPGYAWVHALGIAFSASAVFVDPTKNPVKRNFS